jgi:hypothetical protein
MTARSDVELEMLLAHARRLPDMTPLQKRAQAINFAVYNLLLDRPEYAPLEWELHVWAAKAYDARHGWKR